MPVPSGLRTPVPTPISCLIGEVGQEHGLRKTDECQQGLGGPESQLPVHEPDGRPVDGLVTGNLHKLLLGQVAVLLEQGPVRRRAAEAGNGRRGGEGVTENRNISYKSNATITGVLHHFSSVRKQFESTQKPFPILPEIPCPMPP